MPSPNFSRTKQFSEPAMTWDFPHNLQRHPHVTARIMHEGVLTEIIPKSVLFPEDNLVRVTWSVPRIGEITLS